MLKHPLPIVAQSTALVQRLGRSESCYVTILWVGRPPPPQSSVPPHNAQKANTFQQTNQRSKARDN